MKIVALIVCIGIGLFFLTKVKAKPDIKYVESTLANKNCNAPDSIAKRHHNGSYIRGRAYYLIELAKHPDNKK
ncbi:hypothetical protein [Algibacter pectinivorans]|uniref:Uncharacterized protein n=1 Tax=Algibacter pectinivorans TaxID=870482 RepID=A0A1I1MCP8_9FLAO|nr:hypothetical protein [Algibacter pectinivorans]SFC83207.1 hypothetical protein SAMN04487987_101175 [Algibacter pectinivorans]